MLRRKIVICTENKTFLLTRRRQKKKYQPQNKTKKQTHTQTTNSEINYSKIGPFLYDGTHTHTLIGSFDAKAKTNFVVDARSIFYSRQER